MDTNPDILKLMEQLETGTRKQTRYAKLQCFFAGAAAVCCAGLLLIVLGLLPQINATVTQIEAVAIQAGQVALQAQGLAEQAQTVMANLETVTKELAQVDLAGMVSNVDSLVTTSQDGVTQALDKINAMDIEALNRAIANLSAVVEPLAKFFKVFK